MKKADQKKPDLAAQALRLREQTCKLLGLDPNNLSLPQRLRVNRASALRLQIDDLEAAQLRGQQIDIDKLVESSEALERLVGGDPETVACDRFAGAKEELSQLLGRRAEGIERGLARDPAKARADLEQRIADAIAKYGSPLVATSPPAPAPVEAVSPPPVEPVSSPPRRPGNVVPLDANSRKPPAGYLKQYEPGESNGVLIAPAWEEPSNGRRK